MLNSLAMRLLWHSFNWLTRLAIIVSAMFAVLIALAIIALRYYLLPDIEQYHEKITASLTSAIGSTVTIGKITGDWDGMRPRLNFSDVRILDKQQQPALAFSDINSSVSWMSLFSAELRLASLEIAHPELLVRRDAQGEFFIGGLALSKNGGGNNLADWLLHQSRMVVRDALVVWVDERRAAPPLVLQQVNLRIENFFSRHGFALRALPPAGLATPLDVRGDLQGLSFDDIGGWRGQLFTQLDYTDVMAWRPWLDLPSELRRGRGALRGWVGIKNGKVSQIAADLDLRDVVTKLAEDAQEIVMIEMHGRAAWEEVDGGFEISSKNLSLLLQNGIKLRPTDFYLRTEAADDGHFIGGEVRANQLQLEILADLSKYLPLEAGLRASLNEYAPTGKVTDLHVQWHGAFAKPDSYKLKGRFDNLGLRQVGEMPGFSGLTMSVDGGDSGGRLSINTRHLMVDAPGVMREPLSFSTMIGQVGWQRKLGGVAVKFENIAVANEDMAGNLSGSYQSQAGTRGMLDLTAKLTRGEIRHAARYTPLIALNKEGNDWLNGALLAGHTEDFRIRIKGNLSDFPLDGTKNVIFRISGHARDAVLEFGKDWPRIENITGEFLIDGNKLEVKSSSATMLGARLRNVSATLPDMMSADLPLEIRGEAEAASKVFLQFIQHSPVRGYIKGFTDDIRASGNGFLALFVRVPLLGDKPVLVSGNIRVQNNDIELGAGVPLLRNSRGVLSFTESGMQASGVTAEILGGPASINMQSAGAGGVHVTVRGRSDLDVLRENEPRPLLNYLHGGAEWDADITIENKSAQVIVKSDLQGIRSSLPVPFAKRADEVMPMRMEKSAVSGGQDLISIEVGKLLNARLVRNVEDGSMAIKHGIIDLGDRGKFKGARGRSLARADRLAVSKSKAGIIGQGSGQSVSTEFRPGVWVVGNLPVLSIQGWEDLAGGERTSGTTLPIDGMNLHVDKLNGYGMAVNNLSIDGLKRGEALAVQLSSSLLNGEVAWNPHGYENGRKLSAHLRNLILVEEEQPVEPGKSLPSDQPERKGRVNPGDLPAVEIAIENLQFKGKHIGRFELVGHPEGTDWRMRRLRITNPDGSLMGDGNWSGGLPSAIGGNIALAQPTEKLPDAGASTASGDALVSSVTGNELRPPPGGVGSGNSQSQINLVLEISDAGKILARSGYPNTVKGGSGRLAANLVWPGSPGDFSYAGLNGTLKLDAGKGQFLQMDPGAGKLLSILSMQALPKHLTTLDFNDVFSKGFQFDNIIGEAAIKGGVMDTQEFHIYGSAAKVALKGSVDLNHETQDLSVKVFPAIGDSVSLLAVFAINPAAGIAGLIASTLLDNPLDKLVSFEYNISGTWSDPKVVKISKAPPQTNYPSE